MSDAWKPKGWIAILLGLILQPFVFLYVNKLKVFFLYLLVVICSALLDMNLQATATESIWYKDIYFSSFFMLICPAHAYWITRNYNANDPRAWFASWWATSLTFISVFISIIGFRTFLIEPFTLPASSMAPTLDKGVQILVSKLGYGNYRYLGIQIHKTKVSAEVKRGDVVVFQYPQSPESDWVKRIIGLEGDRVIYRNKTVYIKKACDAQSEECSGFEPLKSSSESVSPEGLIVRKEEIDGQEYEVLLNEAQGDLTHHYFRQVGSGTGEWVVPEGHFFVLGDSRDNSLDSRFWGFVPKENLIGKVVYSW
ncbi:signal peptidase I [Thalassotalea euphylliae]|uniref:signal peptidase I n=1 Tax=Thalassotalea euphylliae TaxID=1655234 RepID=UPI0036441C4D